MATLLTPQSGVPKENFAFREISLIVVFAVIVITFVFVKFAKAGYFWSREADRPRYTVKKMTIHRKNSDEFTEDDQLNDEQSVRLGTVEKQSNFTAAH